MKELIITKTQSEGKITKTIVEGNSKFFSGMSAGVNGMKLKLVVNHNYNISKSHYVSQVILNDFRPVNKLNYKKAMQFILSAAKNGRVPTAKQLKLVENQLASIHCTAILPNEEKLAAKIDLKGTVGLWLEDWKLGNSEYDSVEDKTQLWVNFAVVLGELNALKGKGTMFQAFESKY